MTESGSPPRGGSFLAITKRALSLVLPKVTTAGKALKKAFPEDVND